MIEATLRLARPAFTLDVALSLPARGVSAIFGRSGCGKTTVLRALAGLEHAAGRIALDDEVWQEDSAGVFLAPHRRAVGYVIQEAALFPHLDVRRNLDFGRKRSAPATPRIALDQAIELLGIGQLMNRRPDSLSGGERQRVAIARALASNPRLLLMDEPLASLDAQRKAEVLPYFDRLHEELDIPIVYVSHAIEEIAQMADHLVLMEDGRVVAAGVPMDVLTRLDLPSARGEGACVVLDAVVAERDVQWQLARIEVARGECSLWVRDHGLPIGRRVRVRVLARDVSLTLAAQTATSIGNRLPGAVEAIADDDHPGLALVRVRVGSVPIVARLTRRSAHALQLRAGMTVWAQVKTVALME